MPLYEYHCRVCGQSFQRLRAIADADAPVECAGGHDDVTRALSLVARRQPGGVPHAPIGGGGCCGGGACGCGH